MSSRPAFEHFYGKGGFGKMAMQQTAAGGERDEERRVKVAVKVKFSQFSQSSLTSRK